MGVRAFLRRHRPGRRRQKVYDYLVAYFVPTWAYSRWHKWYYVLNDKGDGYR